jgi:uncharacterized protein YeaO (DUF488 family)
MTIQYVKSVYAAAEAADGMRLIVMRRYPRGVAKARAHAWLPELAPTLPLVHWYHEHLKALVSQWQLKDPARYETELADFWSTYSGRYLREMRGRSERRLIGFLSSLHQNFGVSLTLLCGCPDHRICHRSLLGHLIAEAEGR